MIVTGKKTLLKISHGYMTDTSVSIVKALLLLWLKTVESPAVTTTFHPPSNCFQLYPVKSKPVFNLEKWGWQLQNYVFL